MTQNGNAEESISFGSMDESFDFLEDDSNQNSAKKAQQPDSAVPNSNNNINQPINSSNASNAPTTVNQLSNVPIGAPSVGIPKPVGINFNAAPMANPPTIPPSKPSASGSRLLLKKTINKANESSLDNSTTGSSQIKAAEPAAPVSTHINNIEELDKDPPEPPKATIPVTIKLKQANQPPIPSIPKQQEPPSIQNQYPQAVDAINAMNSNVNSLISGQSFSQGSSFELFTKMPPVPVPNQDRPLNIPTVSSQPQNPTPGKISVQLKPKVLLQKQQQQQQQQQNSSNSFDKSNVPLKKSEPINVQPLSTSSLMNSSSAIEDSINKAFAVPLQNKNQNTQPQNQPPPQSVQQPQAAAPVQQPQPQNHPPQSATQPQNQPPPPVQQQPVQLPVDQPSQISSIEKKDPPKQATIPIKLKVRALQKAGSSQLNSSMIAAPPVQQPQQQPQPAVQVQQQPIPGIPPVQKSPAVQQTPQNFVQNGAVQQPAQQIQQQPSQTMQQPLQNPQTTQQIQPVAQNPVQQIQQQPSQQIQAPFQQQPPVQQIQPPNQQQIQQQPIQAQPLQQQPSQNFNASEIQSPVQFSQQQQQLSFIQQQGQPSLNPYQQQQQQVQFSPPQQQVQYQMQQPLQVPLSYQQQQQASLSSSFQFPSPPPSSTPPQVVYVSPPTSAPYRPSPTILVEQRFANSLDRSFTSFRRFFSAEFSMMMRQPSSFSPSSATSPNGYGFDFDEYSETLSSEVSQIIESPVAPLDINRTTLTRSIVSAIDEQTKPLTTVLSESNNRQATFAKTRLSQLKQLREELDSLCTVFKTNADSIIKELEGESQNTMNMRNAQIAKQNDLEQRMRSVKLRQVELEAKATHQSVERDSLERQLKQLESRRRDWEDQNGYGGYINRDNFSMISSFSRNDSFTQGIPQSDYDSPSGRYRARILSEINSLRKELGRDAFDEVSKSIEEGLSMIRNESDNMKNELIDIDMANRWMLGQIQLYQPTIANVNAAAAASFTAKPAPLPLPMPIPVQQIQPQSQTQIQPNASLLATNGFPNTTTVAMSPVKKNVNQAAPSSPMTKAQMKLNMFRKRREDVVREVQDDLV